MQFPPRLCSERPRFYEPGAFACLGNLGGALGARLPGVALATLQEQRAHDESQQNQDRDAVDHAHSTFGDPSILRSGALSPLTE